VATGMPMSYPPFISFLITKEVSHCILKAADKYCMLAALTSYVYEKEPGCKIFRKVYKQKCYLR